MRRVVDGWQAAACPPGGEPRSWASGATGAGDDRDWWFRTTLQAPSDGRLVFEGLATLSEVFVDGEPAGGGASMWLPVAVPVSAGMRRVTVRCRALAPELAVPRRPRARWRTQLADNALRWQRTTLLGRAPGFAPGPPVVGLWRPALLECGERLRSLSLRPRLERGDGVVAVRASLAGAERVRVRCGDVAAPLKRGAGEDWSGELRLAAASRWWPHTHGEPALHELVLEADGDEVARRRVGFRTVESARPVEDGGLALAVNGAALFARGAVWTPVPAGEERATLERARDAGLNLVRIPGFGRYESPAFHDLCDELGLLVWQDLMFANLDYPFADPGFHALVSAEVRHQLAVVAGRPSLAVVCGSSESEQQVAMLGLDPALARGAFFGADVPALLDESGLDAIWVPSAPCGGARPFQPDRGVANYFGVGGYRRPLSDVRLAGVRFAAECLAIANVPDDAALPARVVHEPAWKAGVPRDAGAGWDFDDVRDHYLRELYDCDPLELRATAPERYLELSRAVSGDLVAEVLGEWRRSGSPCAGAIVLWLRDLAPGAGWGLLDHRGLPKAVLGRLRAAAAPIAVWTTDEGQSGMAVHVANDRPEALEGRVRIALYRDREVLTGEASADVSVAGRSSWDADVETLLGGFRDVSWSYRFGPPAHDLVVASLRRRDRPVECSGDDGALVSSHARLVGGRFAGVEPAGALGVEAALDGGCAVVRSRRALIGARLRVDGFEAADDGFVVEPGVERCVVLRPAGGAAVPGGATLTALNLAGSVALR